MGFMSSIGGMVGGAVGGMFGGPLGAQLGQMIGSMLGQQIESLISQFGQGNVQNAMNNNLMQSVGGSLSNAIQSGGLPQFLKDEISNAISQVVAGGQQSTPAACQQGVDSALSGIGGSIGQQIADMVMDLVKNEFKEEEEKSDGKGSKKGGDNWLIALAKAMAKVQGEHLNKMMSAQEDMKNASGESEEDRQKFIDASAEFQAESKMYGMAAEATSTVLKTIGEGLASLARKQ